MTETTLDKFFNLSEALASLTMGMTTWFLSFIDGIPTKVYAEVNIYSLVRMLIVLFIP